MANHLNHALIRDPALREQWNLARHFLCSYLASREGLKELGILRTERNLQGDFAEWIASHALNLKLAESTIQTDFDATDDDGKTYQIKARLVTEVTANTSFDFKSDKLGFDYLIGVFLSPVFEVLGLIKVAAVDVRRLGSGGGSDFRFRWNKFVANDPAVERPIWPSSA